MSVTAYEYLSVLQAAEAASEGDQQENNGFNYTKLLENVRSVIAEKHSKELSLALGSPEAAKTLKTLILKYCVDALAGQEFDQRKLVEKIHQDMAGLGI